MLIRSDITLKQNNHSEIRSGGFTRLPLLCETRCVRNDFPENMGVVSAAGRLLGPYVQSYFLYRSSGLTGRST
jgi:hypothetical protein